MIKLTQAVIVEGRYDAIKLDSVFDGLIITTEGFGIFKDSEKQALIKKLAETVGIIVLTDSDSAGFKIRKFIGDIAANGEVFHAYIPEVEGKERRKAQAGREGFLGVEGVDGTVVETAIKNALEGGYEPLTRGEDNGRLITVADLYEDGISGKEDSEEKRLRLKKLAGIPKHLSTKAFIEVLNRLFSYEEYKRLVEECGNKEEL